MAWIEDVSSGCLAVGGSVGPLNPFEGGIDRASSAVGQFGHNQELAEGICERQSAYEQLCMHQSH